MEAKTTVFNIPEIIPKAYKTKEEIQKKYAELCGVAGDKQYQVMKFKAQLDIINEQLFGLDKEYMSLSKEDGTLEATQAPQETKAP